MSGYEKVSLLKFEAAGQSWLITDSHGSETPGHSWVDVRMECDDCVSGRVCLESWSFINGGHMMRFHEKTEIVEYLRANPLPGETE